ncbi:MAG: DUF1294 domain-containing protein [Clostridium sp.]|nr:DUF1294 domain-containing protein [Acetatifactor muris]MCM1526196.1 DUF1294 domain-containing protein [Bacteroides sp.]MCM1562656.1 DUF1294 domain-containing protein [Clostridium sp.]
MNILILLYLTGINVTAFALMGMDKRRARQHAWRISEKTLFLSAILGGSVGAYLGMRLFRHKTRHWYFVYGIPAIFLIQAGLGVFWYMHVH